MNNSYLFGQSIDSTKELTLVDTQSLLTFLHNYKLAQEIIVNQALALYSADNICSNNNLDLDEILALERAFSIKPNSYFAIENEAQITKLFTQMTTTI